MLYTYTDQLVVMILMAARSDTMGKLVISRGSNLLLGWLCYARP